MYFTQTLIGFQLLIISQQMLDWKGISQTEIKMLWVEHARIVREKSSAWGTQAWWKGLLPRFGTEWKQLLFGLWPLPSFNSSPWLCRHALVLSGGVLFWSNLGTCNPTVMLLRDFAFIVTIYIPDSSSFSPGRDEKAERKGHCRF